MPPNLYYKDVDKEYLKGYFDEMDEMYKKTYDEPLDKRFKFPVDRFSVPPKDLSKTAQKLRFKFKKEYDSIKKDLDNLGWSPIPVRPRMNSAFEAICIQVYSPPGYNAYMLRRQEEYPGFFQSIPFVFVLFLVQDFQSILLFIKIFVPKCWATGFLGGCFQYLKWLS